MKGIGFIGVGAMGASMVKNLHRAGFEVSVYARHPERAQALADEGIPLVPDVAALCRGREFIITIIGAPRDVEQIYFGEGGILDSAEKGAVVIDSTTSSSSLARRIYAEAKKRGISAIDAPVSGGVTGAAEGTMTIMAGGDAEDIERARPLFEVMGGRLFHTGGPGSGQSMKLANQVAAAGAIGGLMDLCEYVKSTGMDLKKTLEIIMTCTGNTRQMELMAPKLLAGDLDAGFMIRHYYKDLGIARDEAAAGGGELAVTDFMYSLYGRLVDMGYEDRDFCAVVPMWDELKEKRR